MHSLCNASTEGGILSTNPIMKEDLIYLHEIPALVVH